MAHTDIQAVALEKDTEKAHQEVCTPMTITMVPIIVPQWEDSEAEGEEEEEVTEVTSETAPETETIALTREKELTRSEEDIQEVATDLDPCRISNLFNE